MSQEFQSSLAGWVRFRVSGGCSLRYRLGLQSVSWRFDWDSGILFQDDMLTWLLQHPHDMAPSFPQNYWSKREQDARHNIFYNLTSEVTHCYFCSILWLDRLALFIVRGNYPVNHWPTGKPFIRAWVIGVKDHWGSFWRLTMAIAFQTSLSSTILSFIVHTAFCRK